MHPNKIPRDVYKIYLGACGPCLNLRGIAMRKPILRRFKPGAVMYFWSTETKACLEKGLRVTVKVAPWIVDIPETIHTVLPDAVSTVLGVGVIVLIVLYSVNYSRNLKRHIKWSYKKFS